MNRRGKFKKTNDAIKAFKVLKYLTEGIGFNIYLKNITDRSFRFQFIKQDKFLEKIELHLEYFELLKKVENLYKLKFQNISDPTNEYYSRMELVVNVAENRENFIEWDEELRFDLDEPNASLELLLKLQSGETKFEAECTKMEELEIHGQVVNIGYKVIEYCEPYITNLENVTNDGERLVKVRSRKNQVKVSYSKTSRADTKLHENSL